MSPYPDQRQSPRFPIAYQVKLIAEDQIISYPTALDISLGGVMLGGAGTLPVGSSCGIAILLGEGRRVVARGTVVRSDPRGMAIQFSKALDAASEASLRALIQSIHAPDLDAGGTPRGSRRIR
jgi:hypothetical protein